MRSKQILIVLLSAILFSASAYFVTSQVSKGTLLIYGYNGCGYYKRAVDYAEGLKDRFNVEAHGVDYKVWSEAGGELAKLKSSYNSNHSTSPFIIEKSDSRVCVIGGFTDLKAHFENGSTNVARDDI